ncbi:MAG: helix-turn-helix domain-containing protein [Verrucomicrobiaceae bacterium]
MAKVKASRSKKHAAAPRRSPCPVACSLDIVGDRWTLLVIRDLMFGRTRFKDFSASPEGIPTNILSERLARLLRYKIVEQIPAHDGTKHFAYQLTEKGKAIRPMLEAMKSWGLAWEKGTRAILGD